MQILLYCIFKRNNRNINEISRVLKLFLKKSKDEQSIYRKMIDEHNLSEEDAFLDIVGLLFGGHDTTSHGLLSCLYFLKKNPHTSDKLKEELKKSGISKDSNYSEEEYKEKIHS